MSYVYDPADNLHGFYIAKTNILYRAMGNTEFAADLDALARNLVYGLWQCGQTLTDDHVLAINSLYSRTQPRPTCLYWELVSACAYFDGVETPEFFRMLATLDKALGKHVCRDITAFLRDLLLRLADPTGKTAGENEYINGVVAALNSVVTKDNPADANIRIFAPKPATGPEGATAKAVSSGAPVSPEACKGDDGPEDLDALLAELDSLVGMAEIKSDVKSLINLIKVRKLREEAQLTVPPMSLHMVFYGNPGTGKTTVARLLSRLYRSIGVLSKGTLVEVDRSGLVAGYVGQTALKTAEAVKKAEGGVLFIDEAYALAPEGAGNDYGAEAIEVILKSMEDKRGDLVVIAAGYEKPMERFIASNPGLESRFGKYFFFDDYKGDELFEILKSMCEKNMYRMDEEAAAFAASLTEDMYANRDENFGNARDVRNMFERAVSRHSDRLAAMESPTKEDLMTFVKSDFAADEE